MVTKIPKYSDNKIYDLRNKGFSDYVIDGHAYLTRYENVFRPVVINGIETMYIIDRRGNVYNSLTGRRLKSFKSSGGYYRINLQIDKNHAVHPTIHRLVAIAFIPNPNKKPDVNHKDGKKNHNYLENLEWVTKSENVKHAFRIGLMNHKGSRNAKAVLNEKLVELIWDDIHDENNPKTLIEIARKYKVSKSVISDIYRGHTWAEIYKRKHRETDARRDKKYTDEQIKLARKLFKEGKKSINEISEITKINSNYLYNLRQNKYRKDI